MNEQPSYDLPVEVHARLQSALEGLTRGQVASQQALRDQRREANEGLEAMCLELLDVVEMLDTQIAHLEGRTDEGPWRRLARNLQVTRNRLFSSLERRGVRPIALTLGEQPDYGMCVAVERRASVDAAHRLESVVREGYWLADRVLRAAEVVVAGPVEP